jgi:biopolymer transport protein ExbB
MNSPFSLLAIWTLGDPVSNGVAILLITMSVTTWILIALKTVSLIWQHRLARKVEGFWHSTNLEQGLMHLGPSGNNPFYLLASRGHEAVMHIRQSQSGSDLREQPQLHDRLDFSDWVTRGLHQSIDLSASSLQSGMAVLGSIGSTAPFIGLFGTVWGIYHALIRISSSGQTSIELVAGPIGEALVMTALGLGVAIPAVLAYNALNRANKTVLSQLKRFAHDLHAYFVTGTRVDNKSLT